ncbi:metal-dependent hydrolase [Acidaminococcus fermentans]|uniref:metal-dependent hydrolase n=1 Tax=Acidaminococcus fermentans TaxID=905 RepID=UPI00242F766B|nr:metal-dependent hydrolase [Acidaminococcus fermentans]
MLQFHYIHHACFTLSDGKTTLLFDPYLEGNPEGLKPEDVAADVIFISHYHGDHLGSAYEIAKKQDALIISTAEIANDAAQHGLRSHAMHLGGTHQFPFGRVRVTPAFHGSGIAGGHACGFVVEFGGKTVYFAGDTSVFGDMALLPRLETIDVALLPIGDNFTMGPKDARLAAELLNVPLVIPIHYNTWPLIAQDPAAFKKEVETTTQSKVLVVEPGKTVEL